VMGAVSDFGLFYFLPVTESKFFDSCDVKLLICLYEHFNVCLLVPNVAYTFVKVGTVGISVLSVGKSYK
jgi:hypothetical protein